MSNRYSHHTSTNNARWVRLSAAFLQTYPFCVLCMVHGQANQGASEYQSERQRNLIVDHITPHRGDPDLFWDQDNWQTLCRYPCHDSTKQRHEQSGGDASGWFASLRRVMLDESTAEHVATLAHWLPDRVRCELMPTQPVGDGGGSAK